MKIEKSRTRNIKTRNINLLVMSVYFRYSDRINATKFVYAGPFNQGVILVSV